MLVKKHSQISNTAQRDKDLHDYLLSALSPEQLKTFNESYKAMAKDLGDEGAANVLDRIKKVVVYAVNPAVELVRANGETPELAYMTMSRQLTPDFIHGVISLVRDTLTPTEWKSVKQHFAPMLKIMQYWERICAIATKTPDAMPITEL
ncbi:hypothetical protein COOONC_13671 [Cooperia oncophora]